MYKSFVSLGRYITKYFIIFVSMVNGIVYESLLSVINNHYLYLCSACPGPSAPTDS